MNFADNFYNALNTWRGKSQVEVNAPVYILSKGRSKTIKTSDVFTCDNISHFIVVEREDFDAYLERFKDQQTVTILALPESNRGIAFVRNFIKKHATESGAKFFWMFDDDFRQFKLHLNGRKIDAAPSALMRITEDATFPFPNIGASGLNHDAFAFAAKADFRFNRQVCGAYLINTSVDSWFRDGCVEDTDFSLQLLYSGWVTVVFFRMTFVTPQSLKQTGGNTEISFENDGKRKRFDKLCENFPSAKFSGYYKNGQWVTKPSNVWKTFPQVPVHDEGTLEKFFTL